VSRTGSEATSELATKWVPKPEAARLLAERNGRDAPYSDKWLRELEKRGEIETRREGGRVLVRVEVTSEVASEPTSEALPNTSELTSELIQQVRLQYESLTVQLDRAHEALQKSAEDLRKKDEDLAQTRRQLDAVTGFLIASLVRPERLRKSSEVSSELVLASDVESAAGMPADTARDSVAARDETSEVSSEAIPGRGIERRPTRRIGKRPGRLRLAWLVLTGQMGAPV